MERGRICEAMVFAVDNAESASEVRFLPVHSSDILESNEEAAAPWPSITQDK